MKEFLSIIFFSAVYFCAVHQSVAQTSEAALSSPVNLSLSAEAVAAGIGGKMIVAVKVNAEGRVKEARVVGGPSWPCGGSSDSLVKELRKIAVESIKQAQFTPAMKKGKPVSSELVLSIDLDKSPDTTGVQNDDAGPTPRVVKSGVINGRAKSLPKPEYPSGAKSMRITGIVSVQVMIGTDGIVKIAGVASGHPQLADAARDAACAARFEPVTLEGKPVEINGVVTYSFH